MTNAPSTCFDLIKPSPCRSQSSSDSAKAYYREARGAGEAREPLLPLRRSPTGADPIEYAKGRLPRILVFPDSHHQPAGLIEASVRVFVAPPVLGEFLGPPPRVRLRLSAVDRAAVPEAPVHEDGNFGGPEHDVCVAPESREGAVVNAVSKAQLMKGGSQASFGRGVPLSGGLHAPPRLFRRGQGDTGATLTA